MTYPVMYRCTCNCGMHCSKLRVYICKLLQCIPQNNPSLKMEYETQPVGPSTIPDLVRLPLTLKNISFLPSWPRIRSGLWKGLSNSSCILGTTRLTELGQHSQSAYTDVYMFQHLHAYFRIHRAQYMQVCACELATVRTCNCTHSWKYRIYIDACDQPMKCSR